MSVVALDDIREGEEITTSYLEPFQVREMNYLSFKKLYSLIRLGLKGFGR